MHHWCTTDAPLIRGFMFGGGMGVRTQYWDKGWLGGWKWEDGSGTDGADGMNGIDGMDGVDGMDMRM